MEQNLANVTVVEETLKFSGSTVAVGVDQGEFSHFPGSLSSS